MTFRFSFLYPYLIIYQYYTDILFLSFVLPLIYKVQEVYSTGQKVMSVPDTYYFFPIKQSSIEGNPNLEQNKDWGGTFNPALE